jgi:hypothetical protein
VLAKGVEYLGYKQKDFSAVSSLLATQSWQMVYQDKKLLVNFSNKQAEN